MKNTALAALFAAMSLVAGSASAQTINFDDLSDNGSGTSINNGYAGLNWSNFGVLNTSDFNTSNGYASSGYSNGTVSGPNVAFNEWGFIAATISANGSQAFNLSNGYFTSAFDKGLQIQATGTFVGGASLTDTFTVNTTGSVDYSFHWNNLTSVSFSAIDAANIGGPTQFALDNLNVTITPIPAAIWLALSGLASLGAFVRRRVA